MIDFPYSAEYVPQHSDVLSSQKHAARFFYSPRQRYLVWLYLVPIGVAVFGVVGFLYGESVQAFLATYIGGLGAQLVPLFLVLLGLKLGANRLTRWNQKRCTDLLEKQAQYPKVKLTVSETQLQWESANSGSWFSYAAIERLFLTPTTLGVVLGGSVVAIPRSAIGSNSDLRELIEILFEHLSMEAQRLSGADSAIQSLMIEQRGRGKSNIQTDENEK